jgi:hypothetical protein
LFTDKRVCIVHITGSPPVWIVVRIDPHSPTAKMLE